MPDCQQKTCSVRLSRIACGPMFDCAASLACACCKRVTGMRGLSTIAGMRWWQRWVPIVAVGAICVGFSPAFARISAMLPKFAEDHRFSITDVSSPFALTFVDQWLGWSAVTGQTFEQAIWMHLRLDLLYMVAYGLLLFLIINLRRQSDSRPATPADEIARRRFGLRFWLGVVIVLDLAEAAGLLQGAHLLAIGEVTPEFATTLAVLTSVKWIALITLAAAIPSWRLERATG